MSDKNSKPKSNRRKTLTIVCVILGVILALLLAGVVYVEYLLDQMHYVDSDAMQQGLSQSEIDAILGATDDGDEDASLPTMNPEDVLLESYDGVGIGTEAHIVNILLIGADYQGTDHPRSDTTILVTFNTEAKTLTMTSFMRDLYVNIPGYAKNKLNAAYSLGGMSLLKKTLNENFGIYVDGIVEVDFTQFIGIIDLLGGVDLELTSSEASWINKKAGSSLSEGMQHLTGREAIWYARNRTSNGGGDYNRTNRQRTLLNTLLDTYKNASLTTIVGMLDDILPMITTDMTKTEITNYVTVLFPLLLESEVVSQRIPIDDGHYMTKINGLSVLVPDLAENVQFLQDTLLGE